MNSFWTGNPEIDSWLFIGIAVCIVSVISVLLIRAEENAAKKKFEKDKEKFWKEVAEGREPEEVPSMITHDGRRYTDPRCLMHKMVVERDLKLANEIVEREKRREHKKTD